VGRIDEDPLKAWAASVGVSEGEARRRLSQSCEAGAASAA